MRIDYQAFPLPTDQEWSFFSTKEERENDLKERVADFRGFPIAIRTSRLPAWYYLLVFKYVYPISPEMVMEWETGSFIVLYTVYREEAYLRPDEVHQFSALLDPVFVQTEVCSNVEVDLSALSIRASSDAKGWIEAVRSSIRSAETVVFFGETDPLSALIVYVLWRLAAKRIIYRSNDQDDILL